MLINLQKTEIEIIDYEKVELKGYSFYWKGLIWKYGKKAGKETVLDIAENYINTGKIDYIKIFGAFTVVIQCPDKSIMAFCDNSNMQGLWIGENYIGDNFLEIVKAEKSQEFDLEAVSEFLILGTVYFGKSLVKGIGWCENENVYIVQSGMLEVQDKGIGKIDDKTSLTSYEEFFERLAYSIKDEKVTLSLTGGYDSRMILAGINRYMDVNIFISGDNKQDEDIIYAEKAANAIGKQLEILAIGKPEISEKYIQEEFEFGQGQLDGASSGRARINAFLSDRQKKGYKYYLTGDGGTMHKDWYWMQDFPFYNKKTVNLKKYYRLRVLCIKEDLPLGKALVKESQKLETKFIEELKREQRKTNSQSYDAFKYNILAKDSTKLGYTVVSECIVAYAPLWERELVKFAYRLPRKERFFYNYMRKVTTNCCPEIARVATCYGTTASSEARYLVRDVFFQLMDYGKKACRVFGRKFFKKSFFIGHVCTWDIESEVRALEITKQAIKFGKQEKLIKKDISNEEIPYSILSKILHLYMLNQYMNKNI